MASTLARSSANALLRSSVALRSSQRLPALSAFARYYASKFPPHTVVTMPALSPTMTAGNIGTWQKQPGDTLAPGDVLVEIETDKAQMDFEFQDDGVLAKILKDAGEKDVAVGSPIAVMVEEGADTSAFESFTIDDAGGEKAAPKEAPKEEASESSEPPSNTGSSTAPPSSKSSSGSSTPASSSDGGSDSLPSSFYAGGKQGGRLLTSLEREELEGPAIAPAAKALALQKGVPIGEVKGTGRGGRVTVEDVEKFKPATGGAAPASASGEAVANYEDIQASSMRKTIANRLKQSFNENPHYFVASTISVTKLLKLRAALNAEANGAFKLSVNDFLVKAISVAARKVPVANSSWREEGGNTIIRQHNVVDVSVAVATPVGLMTPIVKNVGGLGLQSISSQIKELGKRARDGKLKPEEYQGGTITISNMGMNDAIDRFTAIINPPQATIVAIGTTKKVAIPAEQEDGTIGVEWDDQITIQSSFDHKVVDGAVGGEFMKELKKVIEHPLELLL